MGLLFFLNLEKYLSASFTQYTVTITQVQKSVFGGLIFLMVGVGVAVPIFPNPGVGVPQKMMTPRPCM